MNKISIILIAAMTPALAFAHSEMGSPNALEPDLELRSEAILYAEQSLAELLSEVARNSRSEDLNPESKQTEDNNNTGLQHEGVTELAYRD